MCASGSTREGSGLGRCRRNPHGGDGRAALRTGSAEGVQGGS